MERAVTFFDAAEQAGRQYDGVPDGYFGVEQLLPFDGRHHVV